jgi:hypothetical protein
MAPVLDLRVRLRDRRNRLYKTGYHDFGNELDRFLAWMESTAYIAAILREIETAAVDYDAWREKARTNQSVSLPAAEIERAHICLEICRHGDTYVLMRGLSSSNRFDDTNRESVEALVDPLVNFIEDRIDDGNAILALLLRYRRRAEWFDQARLHEAAKADTAKSEDALDADLRRFLLDSGIDFPFSQPESPSGKADVVAGLGGDDPLALEIKLFDPSASKDRVYVRKGFSQAYSYASDYGLPAGYLVVFNLHEDPLVFETGSPAGQVPAVRVGEKTIFLIPIRTSPGTPSASRRTKATRHVIDEAYLLEGVNE